MNYRHAFHAGNFADLVKHGTLLQVLASITSAPGSVQVIDTHAGGGVYDLSGSEAQRSGEAVVGIGRLMQMPDLPTALKPLRDAVTALNGGSVTRLYPGSPLLVAGALRPGDSYVGCELRPEEHVALAQTLNAKPNFQTLCVDGYGAAIGYLPLRGRALVLIDPPFERGDDYAQIVRTMVAVRNKNAAAQVMVWLPIKDLETFDGFLRDLDEAGLGDLTVVEARMRKLTDPMKMNGCALVLAGIPKSLEPSLQDICQWVVGTLGDQGQARVWRTSPC